MGRRLRILIATLAALPAFIALPGVAQATDLNTTWIVTSGPNAGTELTVSFHANAPDGFVSKQDNKAADARGFIREPNDHCAFFHFEGRIGGKAIKETDCLQVAASGYSQPFLIEMSEAIKHEAKDKTGAAVANLDTALTAARAARDAGKLDPKIFKEIKFGITHANKLDEDAAKHFKELGGDNEGEKELDKAINLKHDVVNLAPPELKLLQQPVLKPIDAVFQAGAFQTLYTELATDPDGRTLTYTWALVELNDPPCINFEPNTPQPNQAI